MDVDALSINGPLAIEEITIKSEIKTVNTEKEEVVHKLKEALKFLENVNVQNEESLPLANLHAPLDDLLSSLKYFPVENGRCFNDLPEELKANILSESYICNSCAYVAASVCHEWKDIIEKRLKEKGYSIFKGYICIKDRNTILFPDEYCSQDEDIDITPCTSTEEMLKAALIHKMKITLVVNGPVTEIDSKLLAEALTTISEFKIDNYSMCVFCQLTDLTKLTEIQLEDLFNAMEKKTEIDMVSLSGFSTAHLDQGKVIDCLFKVKKLFLAEARNCESRECLKLRDFDPCEPGGPVDMEQFVEKLLQASSGMKLVDLNLCYFEEMPQHLSVNLANALCRVKSVSLWSCFPLQDATREQLIKNILGGGIVMDSLSIMKEIQWKSVISVDDLKMAISNMKFLRLRGDFTEEQLKMAKSLSGVEVTEEEFFTTRKSTTISKEIKE